MSREDQQARYRAISHALLWVGLALFAAIMLQHCTRPPGAIRTALTLPPALPHADGTLPTVTVYGDPMRVQWKPIKVKFKYALPLSKI